MSETRIESNLHFDRFIYSYLPLKLNFQHFLFLWVFLTFGIGDAFTASRMMDIKGIDAEYNFIVQHIYVNYGLAGLIAAKLCYTIVPLIIIASSKEKRNYWFINGILLALTIGGIMATHANLQKVANLPHMISSDIILIYYAILFIFVIVGMIFDNILLLQGMKPDSDLGEITPMLRNNLFKLSR